MNVCFWGTYDTGKPRVRVLIDGLKSSGCFVRQIHFDPWKGVSDKSGLRSLAYLSWLIVRMLFAYPLLLIRYVFSKKNDVVLCAYPGNLDVLIVWCVAKLKGERLALDAFLPVFDTIVEDRRLLSRRGLLARALHTLEGISLRAANHIVVDTKAHADYFANEFGIDQKRFVRAFVGCETAIFRPASGSVGRSPTAKPRILFYGQFIPLHGITTIYEAARLSAGFDFHWRIIGDGQDARLLSAKLLETPLANLEWVRWISYESLRSEILAADVCLGIFGTSQKAARVIPNKVFQIIACGAKLVTRDSPAIRELLPDVPRGVRLIEAGNPLALLEAVRQLIAEDAMPVYRREMLAEISATQIGKRLAESLNDGTAS